MITNEQYVEIVSALERASWYLKCAVEKMEKYLPDPPKQPKAPNQCTDCKTEIPVNDMFCRKCAAERQIPGV